MNVVSTTLFEDMDRYQPYLPAALRAHHNLFRGWTYRIYHDGRIKYGPYGRTLLALEKRGLVELVFVTSKVMIEKAMLWRLLPLWDSKVERFIIRDVDMIAPYRERCAVETWVRSGLAVHSMGDKKGDHNWPAINGMMGFHVAQTNYLLKANSFEELLDRAGWSDEIWSSNYRASGPRTADPKYRVSPSTTNNQFFLGTIMWPLLKEYACEHRLSGSMTFSGGAVCYTDVDSFAEEDLGVLKAIREGSDAIIPFIGASKVNSNIDLDQVLAFYQKNGDPVIEDAMLECEKA